MAWIALDQHGHIFQTPDRSLPVHRSLLLPTQNASSVPIRIMQVVHTSPDGFSTVSPHRSARSRDKPQRGKGKNSPPSRLWLSRKASDVVLLNWWVSTCPETTHHDRMAWELNLFWSSRLPQPSCMERESHSRFKATTSPDAPLPTCRYPMAPTSITSLSVTANAGDIRDGQRSRGKPDQEFRCCIRLIEQ